MGFYSFGNYKSIIALFLIFILLVPSVFADGMSYVITYERDTWSLDYQSKQLSIIDYKNRNEEIIISINSELKGDRGVWLFPIPAKPEKTTIDIVKEIPEFSGYEVKSKIGYEIHNMYPLMVLSQVYPLPFTFFYYIGGVFTAGGGTREGFIEDKGVTVHEHLEKAGLTTELITTEDENELNGYLKEKNLNLPDDSLTLIREYVGKDYSFVISWVSDIEKYKEETGGSVLGVKTTFPTRKIYYPLKLTSIYGETKIPIEIYVLGHVNPKIYSDIKDGTKVNHYAGDEKYTKIEIKSESNLFVDDLWMSRFPPTDVLFADLILISPPIFMIIVFTVCSSVSSILSGLVVFRNKVSIKKLALLGLSNFTTLLGFLIAAYSSIKEKEEKISKLTFRILYSSLVLWGLLFLACIYSSFCFFGLFIITLLLSMFMGVIILSKKGRKRLCYVILFSITFLILTGIFYFAIMAIYPYKVWSSPILGISDTECTSSGITVWVRNDGRGDSGPVSVIMEHGSCEIDTIEGGEEASCTIERPAEPGYHSIRASASGNSARGSVYCYP